MSPTNEGNKAAKYGFGKHVIAVAIPILLALPATAHGSQGHQTITLQNSDILEGIYAYCFGLGPACPGVAGDITFYSLSFEQVNTWTCEDGPIAHVDTDSQTGQFNGMLAGGLSIEGQINGIKAKYGSGFEVDAEYFASWTVQGIPHTGVARIGFGFAPFEVLDTSIEFELHGGAPGSNANYFHAYTSGRGISTHGIVVTGCPDSNQ